MDSLERGRLLSLISHELRSPLGVVRGYLRLLEHQQGELSEQHRQSVAAALKASQRLADLLDEVSALAALERNETALDRGPVTIDELLQAAGNEVSLPEDRLIDLRLTSTPAVAVSGDRELLTAALTSLMSAVGRAQPHDTTIAISARQHSTDAGDGVSIHVETADSGSSTITDHPLDISRGGLGVELPIAVAILNAHGGKIREQRAGSRMVGVIVWMPVRASPEV